MDTIGLIWFYVAVFTFVYQFVRGIWYLRKDANSIPSSGYAILAVIWMMVTCIIIAVTWFITMPVLWIARWVVGGKTEPNDVL